MITIRITDEAGWQQIAEIASAAELRRVVFTAVRARAPIEVRRQEELRRTLDAIGEWLRERLERGGTPEQIRSWEANAAYRRYEAHRRLDPAPLHLHLRHRGLWWQPPIGSRHYAHGWRGLQPFRLDYSALWESVVALRGHWAALDSLIDDMDALVRDSLYPPLHSV